MRCVKFNKQTMSDLCVQMKINSNGHYLEFD
jgi:hypothetical protein